ncbi:MAG: selenocysteine lyase, partial [Sphingobacteriales bacterium BACL12 MAG-120802-bin5]
MESHFLPFRKQIIGIDAAIETPYGQKPLVYADWTASGRMYGPIEEKLMQYVYPNVGNTHTDTSFTGSAMTMAYHEAIQLIKRHVGASKDDVLISSNSGMTGVVNKLQRILGLKVHERFRKSIDIPETDRPIVFCTHMEHHSNQTSWLETIADVEVIAPDQHGLVDLQHLAQLLEKYQNRKQKIAAITSYSNVTGIATPYHTIAAMMHEAGGLCFVDFACSAPYIPINMHPERPEERLDAIYFSPHKFLGGPGSSGIVIFNKALYNNQVPDHPGGGTVDWTNPWGEHKYLDDIELREDGGTPAFIPTMRVAMSIQLKEQMGVVPIRDREKEIVDRVWDKLRS